MKLPSLKSLAVLMLWAIAVSCHREPELPAYVVNNSVHPVDFLTANNYTTLNIEIAYVDGYSPTTSSLTNLKLFLQERLNKTAINVTQHSISSPGKSTVDIDFVRELEKGNRQSATSGKTLTAWIVFLDAEYSESTSTSKVLGISYGASSMAIFEKTVFGFTKPDMPARGALETVVVNHEFGHILGLVNNGTAMVSPHQDNANGAHCNNEKCLMFWKAEANVNLADLLGNDDLPVLDDACVNDLKAAGGK
jgi:hypothetical protein